MTPFTWGDGSEYGADGFAGLARRALELRAGASHQRFPGKRLVNVFFDSSLRTRTSMEAAANDLGVHCVTLNPGKDAWKLEHREGVVMDGDCPEHVKEAVPVLAEYADLLGVRAFAGLKDREEDAADAMLAAFSRWSPVPVISLESARFHPLQGLADAATLLHHLGDVRKKRVVMTWAPHPRTLPQAVPNQFAMTCALLGADLTVAHPEGFDLDPALLARVSGMAETNGGRVTVSNDQDTSLRGALVVYAKNWSGWSYYGRREEETARRATLGDWTVTGAKMALTEDAAFMHCLPVRRNVVVADDVLDSPRSLVVAEAGLRRWTAMALLERMLS